MQFLRPPSCGDGIKALLGLFDFQPPPITAGTRLFTVSLQSLGMALLAPPTAGLPLKSHGHPLLQHFLIYLYLLGLSGLSEVTGLVLFFWLYTRQEDRNTHFGFDHHLDSFNAKIFHKVSLCCC